MNKEKKYALSLAASNSGGYFIAVLFAALFSQLTSTISYAPFGAFQYYALVFLPVVFFFTYMSNRMRRKASDKAFLTFFSILIPCFLVSIFFFGPIPHIWVLGFGGFTGFITGYSSFYHNFRLNLRWVNSKKMAIEAKIELIKIEYESCWHTILIFVTIVSAVCVGLIINFQTTIAPMFKEPQQIEIVRAGIFIGLGYEVIIFVLALLTELFNNIMSKITKSLKKIERN